MAAFYLDRSAIVKRYNTEPGTDIIDELLGNPSPGESSYTSHLFILDVATIIDRLVRNAQLSTRSAAAALHNLRADIQQARFIILPVNSHVVDVAHLCIIRYGLRSRDALDLATAFVMARLPEHAGRQLVLVSSNQELVGGAKQLSAERQLNYQFLDPEAADARQVLAELRRSSS